MVTSWYDTQQCKSGLHKSDPKAQQGSSGIIWTAAKPPDREAEGPKWTAAATRPAVVVQRKPPVPRVRTRPEPAARPAVVVRRKPPVPKRPRPAPRRAPTVDEVPVPKTPPLDERALKRQFDGIFSGEPAPPARSPQPVKARAAARTTDRLHRDAASRRAALDARRKRAATHDEAGAPLFTPRLTARWRPTSPKPTRDEPALTPRLDPSPTSVSTPTLEASATRLSPAKTTPRRPAPVKMAPTPKQPSPRQRVARARRAADAASLERALVAACRARDDGDAGEAAAVAGIVAQSDVAFLCLAYRRWGAVGPDLGGGSCDDEGAWGERAAWAVWAAAELDAAKETVAAAALARRLVAQRTGPAAAFAVAAVRHGAALAKARAEARRQEKLAETVLPFAPSFATPKAQREALAARANARAGADGLSFTDAARVKAARAQSIVAEKRVERNRREADECTFTPNAKRRESVTPVARAKPPQSERPPPPPPPPPPPKREEVVLSARPPPPKRDVDVDLGFVRVRLAASDGDDLPALVDAAAAAHGLDGAQQDRLLVALAAAVLG
ncbi:unnamed protein product [Pelagomonas calceolata]|uniref:Uncharacterized protein n=2 Tax=Pelagomonas calceolata TaxID=35677 RepID=A0A8J2WUS1_9STRA|nr:unnamed protein product [Pelagomonas calceolata]